MVSFPQSFIWKWGLASWSSHYSPSAPSPNVPIMSSYSQSQCPHYPPQCHLLPPSIHSIPPVFPVPPALLSPLTSQNSNYPPGAHSPSPSSLSRNDTTSQWYFFGGDTNISTSQPHRTVLGGRGSTLTLFFGGSPGTCSPGTAPTALASPARSSSTPPALISVGMALLGTTWAG